MKTITQRELDDIYDHMDFVLEVYSEDYKFSMQELKTIRVEYLKGPVNLGEYIENEMGETIASPDGLLTKAFVTHMAKQAVLTTWQKAEDVDNNR